MKVKWCGTLRSPWIREHPYITSARDGKYYDLRKHPEFIREKLEELKPWDHTQAIQSFYQLLEWINGDDSVFETNDSRFSGIEENKETDLFPKKLCCNGSFMMIHRDLSFNVSTDARLHLAEYLAGRSETPYTPNGYFNWLMQMSIKNIEDKTKKFKNGEVHLYLFPENFSGRGGDEWDNYGYSLAYRFLGFGNTEDEVMKSAKIAIESIYKFLVSINRTIKSKLAKHAVDNSPQTSA